MSELATLIRTAMRTQGLTQTALAVRVNRSPAFINMLLHGKRRPRPEMLRAIGEGLHMTEEETTQLLQAAAKEQGY